MGRIASLRKPHPVQSDRSTTARDRALHSLGARRRAGSNAKPAPEQFSLRLAAAAARRCNYELKPGAAGLSSWNASTCASRSRLGLVAAAFRYSRRRDATARLSRHAADARVCPVGPHQPAEPDGRAAQPTIGQDNEFERLRDYTLDDNYKHIDWRSTARRGKLTVKDFQANQSQRVIFLIDCGRMMTNEAAGISLLDHALNAMLMLSYVALRQGDSVGLLCFSDEIQRYVPPRGRHEPDESPAARVVRPFPQLVESRYDEAFVYLNSHCRKRSLVMLITNVIDEVNSNQVGQYLTSMVGRHLPLAVLLRDHSVFDATRVRGADDAGLYRAAAASRDRHLAAQRACRPGESRACCRSTYFPSK